MSTLATRLDALQAETERLFRYLENYDEATLNAAPEAGAWSALRICHHLILAEEGTLRYFKKKLSHAPELKKSGWQGKLRVFALRIFMKTKLKKQAPPYLRGDHLPRKTTLAATAERWRAERTELCDYLLSLPANLHDKEIFKHPFAGRLSLSGTVQFLEGHQARHIKQIERTLQTVFTTVAVNT